MRKWLLTAVVSGFLGVGFVGCGEEQTTTTKGPEKKPPVVKTETKVPKSDTKVSTKAEIKTKTESKVEKKTE